MKLNNGTPEEMRMANAIIPVLENHHQLLATLLVANALASESLPIFLH